MNFKMEALDSHNDDDYSSAVWRYMSRFGYGGCALPKAEFGVKPEYTFQEMHSHHEQLPKFAHKYRSGENRIRHISSLTLTNEWSHHQNDHGVSPGNQMMRQMQPQQHMQGMKRTDGYQTMQNFVSISHYIAPTVMRPLTPQSMPRPQRLQQIVRLNSSPPWRASILDLNDDCLEVICQHLNQFELYALRDVHTRFAPATEYCFGKLNAQEFGEFHYEDWQPHNLIKILEYFGHCMTRVKIDKCFGEFVDRNAVSQSFLSERLANIQYLCLMHVDHFNGVEFISSLAHIHELKVWNENGWMPSKPRWTELIKLTVEMYAGKCLRCPHSIQKLLRFLSAHKTIQSLNIAIHQVYNSCNRLDQEKLLAVIARDMCNVTELKLCTSELNKNWKRIFMMENLRKIEIPTVHNLKLFSTFRNLKRLHISRIDKISVDDLCEIVKRIPTLTHLELVNSHRMDRDTVRKLIQVRKLSPYCEHEVLHIIDPHYDQVEMSKHFIRNEKYVSCVYKNDDRYPSNRRYNEMELERDYP